MKAQDDVMKNTAAISDRAFKGVKGGDFATSKDYITNDRNAGVTGNKFSGPGKKESTGTAPKLDVKNVAKNAAKDYTGVRRGDLTGVRPTGRTVLYYGREREVWEWRCTCGNIVERPACQVYPQGISCCPECGRKRRGNLCRKSIMGSRVEGTTMTPKQFENFREGKVNALNKSGVRGVSWAKHAKKWTARGYQNGKAIHLGYFDSLEDAAKARARFVERFEENLSQSANQ